MNRSEDIVASAREGSLAAVKTISLAISLSSSISGKHRRGNHHWEDLANGFSDFPKSTVRYRDQTTTSRIPEVRTTAAVCAAGIFRNETTAPILHRQA